MQELVEKLATAFGPSGYEEGVSSIIKKEIEKYSREIFSDNLGNLVALKGNVAEKNVLIAAHMDEIGFMVTFIEENGFLRFTNLGGILKKTLVGARVIFANGTVGIIGQEKLKEGKKEADLSELFIDIGAGSKKEAMEKVKIGDTAAFWSPFYSDGRRMIGKSLDDRVGCAVLIETLKRIPDSLPLGIYFVFTVQEELGLRGARPVSYRLKPDFGLAVDVTRVGDTPEPEYKVSVALGKGPAIKIKDASVICHPLVVEKMVNAAEKRKIPYQLEVLEKGGTDAGAIHLSREGIPSGVISLPCRYIHTPSEMVALEDVENAVLLLVELLKEKW